MGMFCKYLVINLNIAPFKIWPDGGAGGKIKGISKVVIIHPGGNKMCVKEQKPAHSYIIPRSLTPHDCDNLYITSGKAEGVNTLVDEIMKTHHMSFVNWIIKNTREDNNIS